ncbi:ribosomal RNA small subunit methyltransferase E [Tribonema minus]|uniref:16S rRNA (uracil(1498)-N(3))-methyltransferase n=1 Tax=Tribonema minus TaxID=303371 RepID=A0A835ZHN8_9STRA|nr:ribosomal RNA small subunit methyltransferase E [Tribonema minus]
MRLRDGSTVRAFNGRDGEYLCTLSQTDGSSSSKPAGKGRRSAKPALALQVEQQLRSQAEDSCADLDVWLLCAPIKRQRMKLLVEKATELGVTCIAPVLTAHTQEALDAEGTSRLLPIAIEAAEQCERLSLPHLHPPAPLPELLARWHSEPHTRARQLFVCQERSPQSPPLLEALAAASAARGVPSSAAPAAFLVGPEGGFSADEREMLAGLPWIQGVSLGATVLRAETAALYALSCYSSFAAAAGGSSGS